MSKTGIHRNNKKPAKVRYMFGRISKRYDLLNRIMTLGFDIMWRRFLIRMADLPDSGRVLDSGAGTGDIAAGILREYPDISVTAADLTFEMMAVGKEKQGREKISWCQADAEYLPFPDSTFDAVASGFLARNVPDIHVMFKEQVRVLKPGCRLVCLDTSPIPDNILKPLILLYYRCIIPLMGTVIAGEKSAYKYLPQTTIEFLRPDQLAGILKKAGLADVKYRSFMFGNISVHWGTKPDKKEKELN